MRNTRSKLSQVTSPRCCRPGSVLRSFSKQPQPSAGVSLCAPIREEKDVPNKKQSEGARRGNSTPRQTGIRVASNPTTRGKEDRREARQQFADGHASSAAAGITALALKDEGCIRRSTKTGRWCCRSLVSPALYVDRKSGIDTQEAVCSAATRCPSSLWKEVYFWLMSHWLLFPWP
jgi:hypothetical protein